MRTRQEIWMAWIRYDRSTLVTPIDAGEAQVDERSGRSMESIENGSKAPRMRLGASRSRNGRFCCR